MTVYRGGWHAGEPPWLGLAWQASALPLTEPEPIEQPSVGQREVCEVKYIIPLILFRELQALDPYPNTGTRVNRLRHRLAALSTTALGVPPGAPFVTKPNLPNDESGGTLNVQVRSSHRAIGLQAAVGLLLRSDSC